MVLNDQVYDYVKVNQNKSLKELRKFGEKEITNDYNFLVMVMKLLQNLKKIEQLKI